MSSSPSPTSVCFNSHATVEEWRLVVDQYSQALFCRNRITCPCGVSLPIRDMFRCLYCIVWYCKPCAEKHFGMTRDEWARQQVQDKAIESLYLM